MALRDLLDDPGLLPLAREALKVNDRYALRRAAKRLRQCLGDREAAWKTESDLVKEVSVVTGGALIIASIGAIGAGPFAVVAMIGAGGYAVFRGYQAVTALEAERHLYEALKTVAERLERALDND